MVADIKVAEDIAVLIRVATVDMEVTEVMAHTLKAALHMYLRRTSLALHLWAALGVVALPMAGKPTRTTPFPDLTLHLSPLGAHREETPRTRRTTRGLAGISFPAGEEAQRDRFPMGRAAAAAWPVVDLHPSASAE